MTTALPAPIAITCGEPAGIGPDICLALAATGELGFATVLGDPALLEARAKMLALDVRLLQGPLPSAPARGEMHVTAVPLTGYCEPGQLNPGNARHVLALLDAAVAGCRDGRYRGMVTAPVHKGVINDAGIPFTGHTEYLAERTGTPRVVMMLVAGPLRVALATTHLPLRAVPDAITPDALRETLRILVADLAGRFAIARPRVLVLGLNPHAGEGGHLGREDRDIIAPVIDALVAEGLDLRGPLPADTAFTPRALEGADAVLAMYHDQGLPVLKHAGFGEAVNVTLGLPFVRTSVDHGTALDLAGTGRADAGSLRAAIEMAELLAEDRET
ncbi:MAG TPA: 4-hydroxythreonine-4-phosphate dehydrogenase PdxA [Gammaproteobacteria bacterium]